MKTLAEEFAPVFATFAGSNIPDAGRDDAGSELSVPEVREVQAVWGREAIAARLRIIKKLRHGIAASAGELAGAAAAVAGRPVAEKLASEVLPLADACRWLERNAAATLAPRRHGRRHRPLWLSGASFEIQRQPLGVVLVIGPGNYPLFLPAVQALHALTAGNAVLLKPAPGTREVALSFARLAENAGLDPRLLTVLPEDAAAARSAIRRGVDKVIFTGSSENGCRVLAQLARANTPAVMELSGEDAVVVLADADLDLVIRALQFGARWNGGDTCIGPRRLIVHESRAAELWVRCRQAGLPELPMLWFADEEAAVRGVSRAVFGLGASIFTRDAARARELAARMETGFVTINDLIVPTADPRMPFGGRRASGFGVTRGAEGLLEMTHPHVVAVRAGRRSHPHFDEPAPEDARLFSSYLAAVHGRGWRRRWRAVRELAGALLHRKSPSPTLASSSSAASAGTSTTSTSST